jgi:hypothetical protein
MLMTEKGVGIFWKLSAPLLCLVEGRNSWSLGNEIAAAKSRGLYCCLLSLRGRIIRFTLSMGPVGISFDS